MKKAKIDEYSSDIIPNHLPQLLESKASFVVVGCGGKMLELSTMIETAIESKGMSCRVYTRNRITTAAATVWPIPAVAAIPLIGIAVHNLATFNPDYEIGKAIIDHKIYVSYKKKKTK
ncbi:hypothetical protein CWN56_06870 [Klebsiella pneumoniae]|nr:hypothetical protein CWN56_06870 [Klebsiella pneumoniae]